ncbi:MAG: hypothetical protein JXR49_10305, partial [Acidobacteria bacterium]|nr:hypothetical protein [Acidobacteriota bacterium]
SGDWFYFNFRLYGAANRRINVEFTSSEVLGPLGPAVRHDDSVAWSWLGAGSLRGYSAFTCRLPLAAASTHFAFAVPYTRSNLDVFLQRHQHKSDLHVEQLCQSRKGRVVPQIRLGKRGADFGLALTCRHHACEMVGNYVLEGFIEAVLARDRIGERLRQLDILIVPFADMDGVEDGDQGKNRLPYDHNHDYGTAQIYPETRAIKKTLSAWQGRLRVVLDLHCPGIRGDQNSHVFFSSARKTWSEVLKFGSLFPRYATGTLRIDPRFHVAYGEKWNQDSPHLLLKHWASELPGVVIASTLEVPYALAGGEVVLPDSARSFGHDLATTLAEYGT